MESSIRLAFSRLRTRISYKFFLRCSINTSLHLMVEIEFCGCQQRVGYLRFVPIIMSLGVSHATLFHERAFGVLGSLERLCFSVWTATIGKNLTFDNLHNRLLLMVDWCCMCKRSGELINHLLLHCSFRTNIWSFIFALFGIVRDLR